MLRKDVNELIAALRSQYEKVKSLAVYLDLKQFEFRPGDQVSFFGYLQAKEQLNTERAILSGHLAIVRDELSRLRMKLDPETETFLQRIARDVSYVCAGP